MRKNRLKIQEEQRQRYIVEMLQLNIIGHQLRDVVYIELLYVTSFIFKKYPNKKIYAQSPSFAQKLNEQINAKCSSS